MKLINLKSKSVEEISLKKTMIVLLATNFIASCIVEMSFYEISINGYQVFGFLLILGGIFL